MNPVLTEIMVRERRAELQRSAGAHVGPDERPAPARRRRRLERDRPARMLACLRPHAAAGHRRHGEEDGDARGRAILPESSPRSSAG